MNTPKRSTELLERMKKFEERKQEKKILDAAKLLTKHNKDLLGGGIEECIIQIIIRKTHYEKPYLYYFC